MCLQPQVIFLANFSCFKPFSLPSCRKLIPIGDSLIIDYTKHFMHKYLLSCFVPIVDSCKKGMQRDKSILLSQNLFFFSA